MEILILGTALVLSAFTYGSPLFAAGLSEGAQTCLECHEENVPSGEFAKSAHGKLDCASCHIDAAGEEFPHPEKLKPVSCSLCHPAAANGYEKSSHAQAIRQGHPQAASCRDCHGKPHSMPKAKDGDPAIQREEIPGLCGRCHDDPKRMQDAHPTEEKPYHSYSHTVHGLAFGKDNLAAAVCTDCHGTHALYDSADSRSRVFWRNIPKTCGRCHPTIEADYNKSVHGAAVSNGYKESPVCTTCHGEHTILSPRNPDSTLNQRAVVKTCIACHTSERLARKFGLPIDRLATYSKSYHGLARKRGDLHVADCASCHGSHAVLKHTNPDSTIHPDNLQRTCGKCHEGAGSRLSATHIHGQDATDHFLIRFVRTFYLLLIPLVIGGMLLHNGLDFLRKLIRGRASGGLHDTELRMTVSERIQHAVNALSFMALAYTGFLLMYPDAWWAWPAWGLDETARRWSHRSAALLFFITGVYHVLYMISSKRGKTLLRGLMPVPTDIAEAFKLCAYNAGLRKTKPKLSHPFNYIEKSEYWALIWGSFVMLISGLVLAFPNLTLAYLPAWAADLATVFHLYEAILACLAIAVWHFYWVIFDPDIYPMSWAWLTGYIHRKNK